ncbi:hypothetical protein C7974DRAFT_466364 [Boeremia exigua]|uniref:uncharacterized protein n=1 Tax=Boeremia exigua TaxID=749465 RepID=UPI001E8E434A|nr:uncharacterized protein C7974DRAFT_466364 [Boeremia exigua]KAH6613848.1 hypothetical protein C7974DRAFT_466364 [Boeremia exigua]
MVKITIAGGTSNVAQEIVDALVATKKHEILLLSRKGAPANAPQRENVSYAKVDYTSVGDLTATLAGTHTVLSFIAPFHDQDEAFEAQKNLIDASIAAGVQRLAPSEWVCGDSKTMPWYAYKARTRAYLASITKDAPQLQYSCFQPGLFTNYLAGPHRSAPHLTPIQTPLDFDNRRMLVCEGGLEARMTLTTVQDLARVVVRAVEYEGLWPHDGGVRGSEMSLGEIAALGEKLRGSMAVEGVPRAALASGTWTSSWRPKIEHSAFPPDQVEAVSGAFVGGFLLAFDAGDLCVSDAWNRLLPDFEPQGAEEFLRAAWEGKP